MVAELAIFGTIGTTAGLITFLATAVETLNKKYHDFIEGADRLNYCRDRIVVVEQDLRNWRNVWYDKYQTPFPDTSYELFWGRNGFAKVKKMLAGVERENTNIKTFLYCNTEESPKVPEQKRLHWGNFLNSPTDEITSATQEEDWLRRLLYTFFEGSHLKESIDRLKDKVDLLDRFSRKEYWMHLNNLTDANKWINPEELRKANNFQIQLMGAVNNMEIMYAKERDRGTWTLVLGQPAPEETLRNLADGLGFHLDFVTQHSNGYQLITVEVDPAGSASREETRNVRSISFEGLGVELNIKDLLERTLVDTVLRKANESTLGVVATKLVKSIVLLYRAPWTRGLCTCGILIADTMGHEKDICTFRRKQHECHGPIDKDLRFLHLAVALAELCIAAPIKLIRFHENRYKFGIQAFRAQFSSYTRRQDIEHVGTRYWHEIGEEELLRMVHKRTGSRGYKCALESCLELARSERPDSTGVRPERVYQSLEEIVKP